MNTVKSILTGLDWSVWTDLLLRILPALICITFHELSHGYIAYRLGDNTAKDAGRLTLNPIKHIDLFGLVMMIVFRFGWAKPVPVNMYNFRDPKKGMAITALAGPLSNILLGIAALFLYGLLFLSLGGSKVGYYVLQIIYLTAYISLALAVFNILPIPPLDGSKVLFSFLSQESYRKLMRYERYGMLLLLVLVATRVIGSPLSAAADLLFDKLFVFAELGFNLVRK